MMREVLRAGFARCSRRQAEAPSGTEPSRDAFPQRPDLVLIDGGAANSRRRAAVARRLGVDGVSPSPRSPRGPTAMPAARPFSSRARAVQARAARSRALFRAAAARRGAPLRHRHPSRAAQEGISPKPARRNRRHRPGAQTRAAPCFRHRESDFARRRSPISKRSPGINAATAKLVYDYFHDKA